MVKNTIRGLNDIDETGLYHIVGIIWAMVTDRDPKGANVPLPLELHDRLVPCQIIQPPGTPRLKEHAIKTIDLEPVQAPLNLLKNMFGGIDA